MGESFLKETAVTRDSADPHRWHARLSDAWDTPGGIHGGVLVATATRAALAGANRPDLRLRNAHAVFLQPPSHDLFFDVTVLREGRGSAHVRVAGTCAQQQHPALDVTVVMTADRESPAFMDDLPPEVPSPDEIGEQIPDSTPQAPFPGPPPLFDHLDVRTAVGRLPWNDDWEPDQHSHHVRWARYIATPRLDDGTVDPLSLLPLADLPGPSIWQRFPPDEPMVFFMSLDLSLNLLEPVTSEWILTDINARRMGEGHVYVETDLWSGDRLVATSSQTMMIRQPRN
jgi:acyl-CoA thioesterase